MKDRIFSANADSILRVKCDDQDVGSEIYLQSKFVGRCPVDVPAPLAYALKLKHDDVA